VNRSLVPARPVEPPKELQAFFDDPPLVGSERRSDYDAFLAAIATAVLPVDAIDWILLHDLVGREWEIRRERRMKAEIIKFHQKEVVVGLLKATFDNGDRLGSANNRIFLRPTKPTYGQVIPTHGRKSTGSWRRGATTLPRYWPRHICVAPPTSTSSTDDSHPMSCAAPLC
jgi:hypothetical protein